MDCNSSYYSWKTAWDLLLACVNNGDPITPTRQLYIKLDCFAWPEVFIELLKPISLMYNLYTYYMWLSHYLTGKFIIAALLLSQILHIIVTV